MSKVGCLFVIAAPSGGGKTSLVRALLERLSGVRVSVSYTTRPMRPDDQEGEDYHFVDEPTFQRMVEQRAFVEHAEVFGHHYGTSRQWLMDQLAAGTDVILEIDWQGARLIKQIFHDACLVNILPPSMAVLEQRLMQRNQDSKETVRRRMGEAFSEMSHCHEFDYLIINDEFEQAVAALQSIVVAQRSRVPVMMQKHEKLLAELIQNG